jgi:hypothetical protein
MALPDHLADLERKVSARFSEALAEIRLEMRRAVQAEAQRASSAMLSELEAITPPRAATLVAEEDLLDLAREAGAEGQRSLARALRTTLVEFDAARTQNAVLQALLAGARQFGDRAALWLMRPQEIVGWASVGFAGGFAGDPIAGRTLAHSASPALARLATGRSCVLLGAAEAAPLADALAIVAPARALFVPLVLRDRIAAALYLDAAGGGAFEVEALQVLALAAAQRLELQALATRSYTPTLFLEGEAPASERGLELWDPSAPVASGAGSEAVPAAAAAVAVGVDEAESDESASPEEIADDAPLETAAPTPSVSLSEEFEMAADPFAAAAEEEPATLVEPMPTLTSSIESSFEAEAAAIQPEPPAEEISWQLEESGESSAAGAAPTAAIESAVLAAAAADEPLEMARTPEVFDAPETSWPSATPTHEIPLSPPTPDLEAAERFADAAATASAAAEWREVDETTAPHSTFSAAATQRFPAVTNEFPQPDVTPPAPPEPGLASSAATIAFVPPAAALAPPPPPLSEDAGLSEDSTVMLQRPAPAPTPPAAPPPAPPAPTSGGLHDDEPTVSRPRTTEVAPPADLQGPGWAFSSLRAARSTGDNALHEEARRLARLLVSEIKLYNEDQVEEGRHNRDIYHRLKDDIDRSRQIYEERVHESVRGTTDYFQQELIRSLAGGDPRALGI